MTPPLMSIAVAPPLTLPHAITPPVLPTAHASFASMLADGVDRVSANVTQADSLVRAFALDDSIPVHQVTFALEQARLSLELMLQVRSRLVEAYQQLSNMQL